MIFPAGIWIIIAVSFLFCCMGFKKFVWFMSIGYGMSSAGIGLTLLIMSLVRGEVSVIYLLQCIALIVYGIRLGGFLLYRTLKNPSYRQKLAEVGGDTSVPIFVSVFMWVFCGFIYVMQSAGPVYRLLNGAAGTPNAAVYIGVVIAVIGAVLEAVSDQQKSKEKAINNNLPAMNGPFKLCRCPNYFGEILFWTGTFISGIGALQGWQWLVAVIGYGEIVMVMLSGAKRVETRHIKHYGHLPEYNAYADHTPLLFPFIPLYHVTNPDKIAKEEAAKKAKAEARSGKVRK